MKFIKHTVAACALALAGCHAIDSSSVPTEDIVAHIDVESRGLSQTEVRATLTLEHDHLAYIRLGYDDRLSASAAGQSTALHERLLSYHSVLPTNLGDIRYRVALHRALDEGAPDSSVLMPMDFNLYPPQEVYTDEGVGLAVEWDHLSDEAMFVHIEGRCIDDYDTLIPEFGDDGKFVISEKHLLTHPWWDGQPCQASVTLERIRTGDVDRRFASGSIIARQKRSVGFVIYQ